MNTIQYTLYKGTVYSKNMRHQHQIFTYLLAKMLLNRFLTDCDADDSRERIIPAPSKQYILIPRKNGRFTRDSSLKPFLAHTTC